MGGIYHTCCWFVFSFPKMYNLGEKFVRAALTTTMSGFYKWPSYQGISFVTLSTAFAQLKIQQQLPKITEQVDCPSHTHILVRPWTYCSQREGAPTYFREGSSQAWYDVVLHKQFHWSAIIQEQQDMVELPVIQPFSILKE